MQINNNTSSPNFGRLKINLGANKTLSEIDPKSEIFKTLEYAQEALKNSKYHLTIDKNLKPIISTPSGERYAGGFKIAEPRNDEFITFSTYNGSYSKTSKEPKGKLLRRKMMIPDYFAGREIYRKFNKLSEIERAESLTKYLDTVFKCSQDTTSLYHAHNKLLRVLRNGYEDKISGIFSRR